MGTAEPQGFVTVSITRGGGLFTTECPQSRDSAGIEHLTDVVIGGFRTEAIERLRLNGLTSFRLFPEVLTGAARLHWQRIVEANGNSTTPQAFILAQNALVSLAGGGQQPDSVHAVLDVDVHRPRGLVDAVSQANRSTSAAHAVLDVENESGGGGSQQPDSVHAVLDVDVHRPRGLVDAVSQANRSTSAAHAVLDLVMTDDCSICKEPANLGDHDVIPLQCCGKSIHKTCMFQLLAKNPEKTTCPMCREEVDQAKVVANLTYVRNQRNRAKECTAEEAYIKLLQLPHTALSKKSMKRARARLNKRLKELGHEVKKGWDSH